jgi:hypothetical protein
MHANGEGDPDRLRQVVGTRGNSKTTDDLRFTLKEGFGFSVQEWTLETRICPFSSSSMNRSVEQIDRSLFEFLFQQSTEALRLRQGMIQLAHKALRETLGLHSHGCLVEHLAIQFVFPGPICLNLDSPRTYVV